MIHKVKQLKPLYLGTDGIVLFGNMAYGNYTIKETKAPAGYVISNDVITVHISSPEAQTFSLKNEHDRSSVNPGENCGISTTNGSISVNPENNSAEQNRHENTKDKTNSILPKTGSIVDTEVLTLIGALTMLLGIGLMFKSKRSCKNN